jgi:hypothetical protein
MRDYSDIILPPASKEYEDRLFAKIAQGCKKSREEAFRRHLKGAISVAVRHHIKDIGCEDKEQNALLWLMESIDMFDHTRGFRFSTYAYNRIDLKFRREYMKHRIGGGIKIYTAKDKDHSCTMPVISLDQTIRCDADGYLIERIAGTDNPYPEVESGLDWDLLRGELMDIEEQFLDEVVLTDWKQGVKEFCGKHYRDCVAARNTMQVIEAAAWKAGLLR